MSPRQRLGDVAPVEQRTAETVHQEHRGAITAVVDDVHRAADVEGEVAHRLMLSPRLPASAARSDRGAPDVAEDTHRPLELLRPAGEHRLPDRGVQVDGGQLVAIVPGHIVEDSVATDAQRPSRRCRARKDQVEQVPAGRLDRLAHQHEPSDCDHEPRLLEHLANSGADHGLSGLHPAAGQEPMPAAVLHMLGQQDSIAVPEADGDSHADAIAAHAADYPCPYAGLTRTGVRCSVGAWEHLFGTRLSSPTSASLFAVRAGGVCGATHVLSRPGWSPPPQVCCSSGATSTAASTWPRRLTSGSTPATRCGPSPPATTRVVMCATTSTRSSA